MLCPYRHIFGEERKGFHSIRVFDIAVGDVVLTIMVAALYAYIYNVHIAVVLFYAMLLGIIIHRMFCVNTKINEMIFGKV